MRRYDASCSPQSGGWCTPTGTRASPAALLRSCHLQSARCAAGMIPDTEALVVAHARGVLRKIPQPETSFKHGPGRKDESEP